MICTCFLRPCFLWPGVVVLAFALLWAWPAEAGSVPGSQVPGTSLPDGNSSSPRRQVHSRTGARVETWVPGSITDPATPTDDEVIVARWVNVNSASAEELAATLPGIGPSKAQAIVEWREAHGPFQAIDQLLHVSGIGPATLENIRPFVRLSDSLSQEGRTRQPSAQEQAVIVALGTIIERVEQDRRQALQAAGIAPE